MNDKSIVEYMKKSMLIDLPFMLLVVLSMSCFASLAYAETIVGKAVNSDGILEYVEHHSVKYINGKVGESQTIYYDADNNKIGELISEYSFGPQFGSYDFGDLRAQYEDGAEVEFDRIRLFRKKEPEANLEDKYIERDDKQIVGQGFHQFIVENLERIAQGEVFQIRLVLPSRLDQYDFRIRKREINGDTLCIRLEIENWFLRLFAPHVEADYDLKTRRLLRYEGISNLKDASGKHQKVTITYSYKS